jgi:hypothetical protein
LIFASENRNLQIDNSISDFDVRISNLVAAPFAQLAEQVTLNRVISLEESSCYPKKLPTRIKANFGTGSVIRVCDPAGNMI